MSMTDTHNDNINNYLGIPYVYAKEKINTFLVWEIFKELL